MNASPKNDGRNSSKAKAKLMDTKSKIPRPYTSWIIYFQLQREWILQKQLGVVNTFTEDAFIATDPSYEGPSLPSRFQDLKLPTDWWKPGKGRRRKRLHRKSHCLISFHELSRMIGDSWKEVDVETRAFCDCLSAISIKKYRLLKASVGDAPADADATIRKTKKNKSGKKLKSSSLYPARATPTKKKGKMNLAIEQSPVPAPPLPVLASPLPIATNDLPVGPSPASMTSTTIPCVNLQDIEDDAGSTSKATVTWSMMVSAASPYDTEKVLVNLYLAHLEHESKSNGMTTDANSTLQSVNVPDSYIRSLWNNYHRTTEGAIITEMDGGSSTSTVNSKTNSITEMDSQNVIHDDELKKFLNTLDLSDDVNEADQDEHLHDELASMPFYDVEDTKTKATCPTIEIEMTLPV
jgi:hypothetical protein